MDKENFRKLLGIAGFVIVTKSLIPDIYNQVPSVVKIVSIQAENEPNLVVKSFDFTGIPQLRIWNTESSIIAGIYFNFLPSLVEIDFQA